MTDFNEAEAIEALVPERDRCAQALLEFMAACGVRVTTTPPPVIELLTAYGCRAIEIGQTLAHRKRTIPAALPDGTAERPPEPRTDASVVRAVREGGTLRNDRADITRKLVLHTHRRTS